MVRTEDLLKKLDQPSTTPTSQFKVYTLINAPAVRVSPKIQEMFDQRTEGSDAKRTPFYIDAIEGSNSLIISAAAEDHLVVEDLISRLDIKSNLNQQLRIFNLEKARAEDTAEVLSELFQSQGDKAEGLANAIAIQAVPWTNSVLVWAAPGQIEDIEKTIATLDTNEPTREMMFEVIQLQQAMAENLAEAITQAFEEQASGQSSGDSETAVILSFFEQMKDGSQALRKLIKQDITIVPYVETNSLMILAPPDSMEMLRGLVARLDDIPPMTAEVEVFQLANASAEQVIETLETVFQNEESAGSGDEGALTLVGVGGAQRGLTFAADQRTNSVIVAGHEQYLMKVKELIADLDAEAKEERSNFVYRAKNRKAADLAQAIRDFNEQENDRLSKLEDETSVRQLIDQDVTVVEVEESNAVALGMSKRYQDQYMQMVEELDRSPDQVLIEFMLIEVQTDDVYELGVEFAAQDLLFSEQAYIGNNDTIKGPDFDFVAGTDLGAAGSGSGFSFTMTGEDFNFLFHALKTDGSAELISRPSLLVEDNAEDARIAILTNVPTLRSQGSDSAGNPTTSVDYVDAGIELQAIPHINPDGFVQLEIDSKVTNVGAQVQVGNTSSVSISGTELKTTVTIKDGETVIIGGLFQSDYKESEQGIPVLADLPLAGMFFRSNSDSQSRRELLIVITATVIRSEDDAYDISIQQRDEMEAIPDRVKRHPMMKGMRLEPGESEMIIQNKDMLREEEDVIEYGPQPSVYGPPVPQEDIRQASYEE